jgi:peptidoglycan/xylan/chitin deacetylase (PgdA/CDA1 family)
MVIYELRRYELNKINKKYFYERFSTKLLPIFDKYGFKIVGAWDVHDEEKAETIYILEWKDLETLQNTWEIFHQDQEWKDIKEQSLKEHGLLVNATHSTIMKPTTYSPIK